MRDHDPAATTATALAAARLGHQPARRACVSRHGHADTRADNAFRT